MAKVFFELWLIKTFPLPLNFFQINFEKPKTLCGSLEETWKISKALLVRKIQASNNTFAT